MPIIRTRHPILQHQALCSQDFGSTSRIVQSTMVAPKLQSISIAPLFRIRPIISLRSNPAPPSPGGQLPTLRETAPAGCSFHDFAWQRPSPFVEAQIDRTLVGVAKDG